MIWGLRPHFPLESYGITVPNLYKQNRVFSNSKNNRYLPFWDASQKHTTDECLCVVNNCQTFASGVCLFANNAEQTYVWVMCVSVFLFLVDWCQNMLNTHAGVCLLTVNTCPTHSSGECFCVKRYHMYMSKTLFHYRRQITQKVFLCKEVRCSYFS